MTEAALAANQHPERRSWLWKTLQCGIRIGTTLVLDLKVYGLKNVPRRGGALIVSNHQSYLDPPLIGARLYRPVSYMARSGLFENRYFGKLIRALHAFPVRQGEGDVGAIRETVRRLKEGHLLNIFPEGSRTPDGEIDAIAPGVGLVARRAGVPIIPCVIDGAHIAWHKDAKFFRAHPVRVVFGAPIATEGSKPAEIVASIDRTLRTMLADLRERERAEGIYPCKHLKRKTA